MAKIFRKLNVIGPATLVAAAFIGPGTVTTCSLAGSSFGYSLIWALVFSIFATIILQEMSARLGLIGKSGLGEALREEFNSLSGKIIISILVLTAIAIGNAAYETGNIMGGAMGLETITGISEINIIGIQINFWGPIIGLIAFVFLYIGKYKIIERLLIGLVILMSLSFLTTSILVKPDITEIVRGVLVPAMPRGSILTIVGLIGTTVVPYNLFLHASAVSEKWTGSSNLKRVRTDNVVSIGFGGLISIAIIITSAAAFFGTGIVISNAGDMAIQLKPLLGNSSGIFLSLGLLAAGVSSAITAPLAAAYATAGILGWKKNLRDRKFRAVWIIILMAGIVFSAIGFNPLKAILFAQVTNGILLPLVALFLLRVMNNKNLLGKFTNGLINNILGFLVVLVTIVLGLRSILSVFNII